MIQTKVLLSHFKGLNFDIEQNVITNPSGNAKSKVIKNSSMLIMNPELKDSIGLVAIIILSFFLCKNISYSFAKNHNKNPVFLFLFCKRY